LSSLFYMRMLWFAVVYKCIIVMSFWTLWNLSQSAYMFK